MDYIISGFISYWPRALATWITLWQELTGCKA
jgi:hypothetical protein